MPYETAPLRTIADAVEEEDFVYEYLPANEARPLDLLLVSIGEDPDEPCIVEMCFPEDLLIAAGQQETLDQTYVLQFLLRYRFSFNPADAGELAKFLLALNRLIPHGAFGMDEQVGTIFLQYALVLPRREVDPDVLGIILSAFDALAPQFAPLIAEVGGGQRSAADALTQVQRDGLLIPPMLPGPASLIEPPTE